MKHRAAPAPRHKTATPKRPAAFIKAGVAVVTLGTAVAILPGATATGEYKPDGLSSVTAAASCWEIKQNNPKAPSGTYWLWTPQMSAPAQFYCDQQTNGGGWVMIGRGREGWTEAYSGMGQPHELHSNPDGTDAFKPVQLPAATVDALLGGGKVSDLIDGVRVRRAANSAGTKWQEVLLTRANANGWSWTLSGTQIWKNVRFSGQSPYIFDSNYHYPSISGQMMKPVLQMYHMNFTAVPEKQWKMGFAYGWTIAGENNDTTHMWTPTGHNAVPFSQMFLRPKLTQADLNLPDYAEAGVVGSNRLPLPNSYSAKVVWRTSEKTGTGNEGELNTYVQAFAQVGDTVFTGGDFAFVEKADTGEKVDQKFLAGYNVHTGELVRSFRPVFNGQVKTLQALPGNLLAVGGEFTKVNGQDAPGLVILNPATGQIDKTYNFALEHRMAGGQPSVRALDVQGDYLYIGGKFTHLSQDKALSYTKNAGRFNLKTKTVDTEWKPNFNGTVNGISASRDGATVSAAGYFSKAQNSYAWKLAHLNTSNGAVATEWRWEPSFPILQRQGYQQDIEDVGASVWAAGAEHIIHHYDKANGLRRINSSITIQGGDFQDLHLDKSVIYGSCHCGNYIYEGSTTWSRPWDNPTLDEVHTIRLTAAFDPVTGEVLPDFAPILRGARGEGIWAHFVDSTGVLWVGGDINSSMGASGSQKTVGFARYTPRDVTAPATPRGLKVTSDGSTDTLTWSKVGGARVSYQILRNNRVIATTTDNTFKVPHQKDARYYVRSVDQFDNFSMTQPAVRAQVVARGLEQGADPAATEPVGEALPVVTEQGVEPSQAPASEEPAQEPTQPAEEPTTAEPSPEAPAVEEPAAGEESAAGEDPAAEEPAGEEPAEVATQEDAEAEAPAGAEPANEEPAAKEEEAPAL